MSNFNLTAAVKEFGFTDNPGVCFALEFTGAPATIAGADTLTCVLPARWVGKPLSILVVQVDQYTTSGAVAGAVTKVCIPLGTTPYTYVESTGTIVITLGATGIANTQTPVAKILLAPATF